VQLKEAVLISNELRISSAGSRNLQIQSKRK